MKFIKRKKVYSPFYVLLRHFLIRLLNNDIIEQENQRREFIIFSLVLFSIAGGYISHKLISPYLYPALSGVTADTIWVKKTIFLTLTMALTGIISVFTWENVYPDRKDFVNLLVLPVSKRTFYAAKFFSLLVFVGLISAAFNIFSLFIFTFYLAPFVEVNIFYFGFSHFITNFLANLFVFLGTACIQSTFSILNGNKSDKKGANGIQGALMVGFISVIVWLPQISAFLKTAKETLSSFFYYFPPLWFTGIYERITGSSDDAFNPLLFFAVIGLIITAAVYFLSFPIIFKRFLNNRSDPYRKKSSLVQGVKRFARQTFDSIFLKHPIQRAMFYFVCATLKRSPKHKLHLVIYLSLPTAYIIADLVSFYYRDGWSYFKTPNFFLIGVSFIFYFFLVGGYRMIVRHPIMLKANWIFQLTEIKEKKHYINGLKKAIEFLLGLPIFIVLFIFYFFCWGLQPAVYHSLYSGAFFLLLMEISFNSYKRMPFAAEFEPGNPNHKLYWPLYVIVFFESLLIFSNLGLILIEQPHYYLLFFPVLSGLQVWLSRSRCQMYKSEDFRFLYTAEPRELMLSLKI